MFKNKAVEEMVLGVIFDLEKAFLDNTKSFRESIKTKKELIKKFDLPHKLEEYHAFYGIRTSPFFRIFDFGSRIIAINVDLIEDTDKNKLPIFTITTSEFDGNGLIKSSNTTNFDDFKNNTFCFINFMHTVIENKTYTYSESTEKNKILNVFFEIFTRNEALKVSSFIKQLNRNEFFVPFLESKKAYISDKKTLKKKKKGHESFIKNAANGLHKDSTYVKELKSEIIFLEQKIRDLKETIAKEQQIPPTHYKFENEIKNLEKVANENSHLANELRSNTGDKNQIPAIKTIIDNILDL